MNIFDKLRIIYLVFFKLKKVILPLEFQNYQLKDEIKKTVYKRFRVDSRQSDTTVNLMVDEIFDKLKLFTDKSVSQRLESFYLDNKNEFDGQGFWFYTQLSGLVSSWEFRIRLLGITLGVKSNKKIDSKSKKNRANGTVEHESLKDIIKAINKKSGDRLLLKLFELNDLRDSIIHCNPHAMRMYSKQLFGKQFVDKIDGTVAVLNIDTRNLSVLKDLDKEDDIEDQDLYAWFIEIFNSGLAKEHFNAFDISLREITLLIEFITFCHGEREGCFHKILHDQKKLDHTDVLLFEEYFKKNDIKYTHDVKKYLDIINGMFRFF